MKFGKTCVDVSTATVERPAGRIVIQSRIKSGWSGPWEAVEKSLKYVGASPAEIRDAKKTWEAAHA